MLGNGSAKKLNKIMLIFCRENVNIDTNCILICFSYPIKSI